MNSLATRLVVAAGVVLLATVALGGFAVVQAVREHAIQAEHDRMQGLVYAVLGKARITPNGDFHLPSRSLPGNALIRPGSGVYALVINGKGETVWQSPSVNQPVTITKLPSIGEWLFTRPGESTSSLLQLAFGIRWVTTNGNSYRYNLIVAKSTQALEQRLSHFRSMLWLWLLITAGILLAVLLGVLRWGLAPLRRVSRKLKAIETGESERIDGRYPSELKPLVDSLNAMIASEKARLGRYRNALADLAHSLKTPISVLQGMRHSRDLTEEQNHQLDTQLGRINEIIDYQLQRAATAGGRTLAPPVAVRPIIERLTAALSKVYADAAIAFEDNAPEGLQVAMDAGDLTEVLGNLLDNAAKYGGRRVHIDGERTPDACFITIDDDGDGFPEDATEKLLERGTRADTRREGQGIGLAMAADIVHTYDGRMALETTPNGGGRVRLQLP